MALDKIIKLSLWLNPAKEGNKDLKIASLGILPSVSGRNNCDFTKLLPGNKRKNNNISKLYEVTITLLQLSKILQELLTKHQYVS